MALPQKQSMAADEGGAVLATNSPLVAGTDEDVEDAHAADEGAFTCDGSVDIRGNPASKSHTGKWIACYSILGGEFCGSIAYYGVGTNLVCYLAKVQNQSKVTAASNIAYWQGTCYLTPLLGAFLADSYWGRHRTIVVSFIIFTLGMVLLTLSATIQAQNVALVIMPTQDVLSSFGLYLSALGLGGLWPCIPTFGADQFDDTDATEKAKKHLYYNWYYFAVNGGFLIASTVLVWVQDNCGWGLGFGIPTVVSAIAIVGFLASVKLYRFQKPGGSALTRICQVMVAAISKLHVQVPSDSTLLYETPGKESAVAGSRKLVHTDGLTFFDRAATITASDQQDPPGTPSPWKLCTVTQVEELKILARMLPILLTAIIFNTAEAVFPLFIEQGQAMDNRIRGFSIPPASLTTFSCLCILILAPSYNKLIMPIVSGVTGMKQAGLPELHRIGVGMVFATISLASAATVEMVRLGVAKKSGLLHHNSTEIPLSILWQAPQYLLVGIAKVFSVVGFIEFAYEQSPDAMRSLCQACCLIMTTIGSYLVCIMLKLINLMTASRGSYGWIPENLNEGRLDLFFWLMAGIQLLNLLAFVYCATKYKHKLST
ncbi:hypothetical protein ACP4OV_009838 [Aristida adscensionis]